MKDLLLTLLHLAVMTATLCGPGGVRAVIAENLLLKQQLIVVRRPRQRAPMRQVCWCRRRSVPLFRCATQTFEPIAGRLSRASSWKAPTNRPCGLPSSTPIAPPRTLSTSRALAVEPSATSPTGSVCLVDDCSQVASERIGRLRSRMSCHGAGRWARTVGHDRPGPHGSGGSRRRPATGGAR